jgi:hypothetical protein
LNTILDHKQRNCKEKTKKHRKSFFRFSGAFGIFHFIFTDFAAYYFVFTYLRACFSLILCLFLIYLPSVFYLSSVCFSLIFRPFFTYLLSVFYFSAI